MGQRTDNPPAYKNEASLRTENIRDPCRRSAVQEVPSSARHGEACCDVCGREHLAKLCTKQPMPRAGLCIDPSRIAQSLMNVALHAQEADALLPLQARPLSTTFFGFFFF